MNANGNREPERGSLPLIRVVLEHPNGEHETMQGRADGAPLPFQGLESAGMDLQEGAWDCVYASPDPVREYAGFRFGVDLHDGERILPLLRWIYDPDGPPVDPDEPRGPTGRMVEAPSFQRPERLAIAAWLGDGGNVDAELALRTEPRLHIYRCDSQPGDKNTLAISAVTDSPVRARHGNAAMPIWRGLPYGGAERAGRSLRSLAEQWAAPLSEAERPHHTWEAMVSLGYSEAGGVPCQPHGLDIARVLYDEDAGAYRIDKLPAGAGLWIVDSDSQLKPYDGDALPTVETLAETLPRDGSTVYHMGWGEYMHLQRAGDRETDADSIVCETAYASGW